MRGEISILNFLRCKVVYTVSRGKLNRRKGTTMVDVRCTEPGPCEFVGRGDPVGITEGQRKAKSEAFATATAGANANGRRREWGGEARAIRERERKRERKRAMRDETMATRRGNDQSKSARAAGLTQTGITLIREGERHKTGLLLTSKERELKYKWNCSYERATGSKK
ncbi:hypothetical protein EDB83DRAFT_1831086 [Lactarius deliciosus]|nr:hypothetical protein EDB83DRAFT_1831086 [Lactarius deliciosus]